MKIDRTVNRLPVLTWNKLDFNEARLKAEAEIRSGSGLKEIQPSRGIHHVGNLSMEELDDWVKEKGISLKREAVVAGKYPMYMAQDFPTGMGAEVDDLYRETGSTIRLYEVESGAGVEEPVRFHYEYEDGAACLEGVLIHAKKGSEVTVIEYFTAEGGSGFVGSSTRVYLEEGAKVHLIKVQMLPKGFCFFDDMGARNEERAELSFTQIALGAGNAFLGVNVDQWGDTSRFSSDMGYIGVKDSFLDFNYVDTFRGKKTEGVMRFHGVLMDNAKKVSRETLDFRQYCTDASGDEQEDVLVLGEDIVNKANPCILGEEEKVSGRHAVTNCRTSEDMLFYMQTRGIGAKTAEQLMVRAAIMEVCGHIADEEITNAVEAYIDSLYATVG